MEKVFAWAEQHPYLAGGATLGGVFLLLWLFGFFGSGSSSASSGQTNLAAAYYAAEAAQTTAATNLQMATVAYGAQTAQTQIQATAATAIAKTQATMQTTLGQQGADTSVALSHDNLLATINSNDDAASVANTAATYTAQTTQAGYQAQNFQTYVGQVIAPTLASENASGNYSILGFDAPGGLNFRVGGEVPDVNALLSQGYTSAQAAQIVARTTGATG